MPIVENHTKGNHSNESLTFRITYQLPYCAHFHHPNVFFSITVLRLLLKFVLFPCQDSYFSSFSFTIMKMKENKKRNYQKLGILALISKYPLEGPGCSVGIRYPQCKWVGLSIVQYTSSIRCYVKFVAMNSTRGVSVTAVESCQTCLAFYKHTHDALLLYYTVPPNPNTEELRTLWGANSATKTTGIRLPPKKALSNRTIWLKQDLKQQNDSVYIYEISTMTVSSDTHLSTELPRSCQASEHGDERRTSKHFQTRVLKTETNPDSATDNMKLIKHNSGCRKPYKQAVS